MMESKVLWNCMDDGAGGGTNVDAKTIHLWNMLSIFMKTNFGFYTVPQALQVFTQVPHW